jgi:predicted ArsR family transcriptional regulator
MNLSEIQNFLKWRKQASLDDFARGFDLDKEQILPILEQLVADGAMQKQYISTCCNDGCDPCVPFLVEYYEMAE